MGGHRAKHGHMLDPIPQSQIEFIYNSHIYNIYNIFLYIYIDNSYIKIKDKNKELVAVQSGHGQLEAVRL